MLDYLKVVAYMIRNLALVVQLLELLVFFFQHLYYVSLLVWNVTVGQQFILCVNEGLADRRISQQFGIEPAGENEHC